MMDTICENGTYIKKGLTQGIWCEKTKSWCGHMYMCTAERKVKHTASFTTCPLRKKD